MIIAGLDISINGTGIVKAYLNDDLDIEKLDYLGFSSKKKIVDLDKDHIKLLRLKDFNNYIDRNEQALYEIYDFLDINNRRTSGNIEYVAIEDYSFGSSSSGLSYHIGEFTGQIKRKLYYQPVTTDIPHNQYTKIRLYDIVNLKIFATGSGNALKPEIRDYYDKITDNKIIFNDKMPRDDSPTSDIIDAYYLMKMLQTELKLRKGLIQFRDLSENVIRIFNRTTKSEPVNLLDRPFLNRTL
jgi:hypothetical protein